MKFSGSVAGFHEIQRHDRYLSSMFQRIAPLAQLLARRSVLLLGPRQTGKSTLVRQALPDALELDLLDGSLHRRLLARPEQLADLVRAHPVGSDGLRRVAIDEVQKIPALLDEVHRLLSKDPALRFVLTGSSARRLKVAGTNLLGGRATRLLLHPIISAERATDPGHPVDFDAALRWGGLPPVLRSTDPRADLLDYFGLYLQEEVRAEGLSRSMQAFTRFLEVAAAVNAEQVVYARVAQDAEVPARTVRDYFDVLEDTLVGHSLPPFRGTTTRKAVATAKFYFFDVGVAHALAGRGPLAPATREYGQALEHMVCIELLAALGYHRLDGQLRFWRTLSQIEVDFVVERAGRPLLAIEVKATRQVEHRDLKGLRALREEFPDLPCLVVAHEPLPRRTEDAIDILPVQTFLDRLWRREILPGGSETGPNHPSAAS